MSAERPPHDSGSVYGDLESLRIDPVFETSNFVDWNDDAPVFRQVLALYVRGVRVARLPEGPLPRVVLDGHVRSSLSEILS